MSEFFAAVILKEFIVWQECSQTSSYRFFFEIKVFLPYLNAGLEMIIKCILVMSWHFCVYIYFVIPSRLLYICNFVIRNLNNEGACLWFVLFRHKIKNCHFSSLSESYFLTKLSHVLIQLHPSIYHRSLQAFFRTCLLFVFNVEIFMLFHMKFYFLLVLQFVILSSDVTIIISSCAFSIVKIILFCVSLI